MLSCLLLAMALGGCDAGVLEPQAEGEVARIVVPAWAKGGSASGVTQVSPGVAEVEAGGWLRLLALDETGQPVEAEWSSTEPSVATVDAQGVVQGLKVGEVEIQARTRRQTARARVRIVDSSAADVSCFATPHRRRVDVAGAAALSAALADARPGDLIVLGDGTYTGRFTASVSGTAEQRIRLCGSRAAVLRTGSLSTGGYALTLKASYWLVEGFSIAESQMGINVVGGSYNVLRGIEVHHVGQEAVHLGTNSRHNTLERSSIHDTGLHNPEYGEGVYIGSWSGHWCARTGCEPDRSDYNRVLNNTIGPNVTAELVDLKEGTTGGTVEGNVFNGQGMVASTRYIDAWVTVFGNGYRIANNSGQNSLQHGYEAEVVLEGWGSHNTFVDNEARVEASGYGFRISPHSRGNRVGCSNRVSSAGAGFSNVPCS